MTTSLKPLLGFRRHAVWILASILIADQRLSEALEPLKTVAPALTPKSAGADSSGPFFSGDDRYLFFTSSAQDLVEQTPHRPTLDLFRYDIASETLLRVSEEPLNAKRSADWTFPEVSNDGDVVVFACSSDSLVPQKTELGVLDIYWKRISTGEIRLVSISANLAQGGNADSRSPVVSADGRYVAFESDASNLALVSGKQGSEARSKTVVYFRDMELANTVPMTDPSDSNNFAGAPHLSRDGRRIGYYIRPASPALGAITTVVQDTTTKSNLYTSTTLLGTIARLPLPSCCSPQLSPGGERIAFFRRGKVAAMELVVHDLRTDADFNLADLRFQCAPITFSAAADQILFSTYQEIGIWKPDTGEKTLQRICVPVSEVSESVWSQPVVDSNFSNLVFRGGPLPFVDAFIRTNPPQLFWKPLPDGSSLSITTNQQGLASVQQEIASLAMSSNGRWVAFDASDSNLVENDNNNARDVFLKDLQSGSIRLLSKHRVPTMASTSSGTILGQPTLTAGGRLLAFSATDGNQHTADTNRTVDVFLRDLTSGTVRSITVGQPTFTNAFSR